MSRVHFLHHEQREVKFSIARRRSARNGNNGKRFKVEQIVNLLRQINVKTATRKIRELQGQLELEGSASQS